MTRGQTANTKEVKNKTKKKTWLIEIKRAEQLCQNWIGLMRISATAQGQHPLSFHRHVHMLQCDGLDTSADRIENLLWEKKKKN